VIVYVPAIGVAIVQVKSSVRAPVTTAGLVVQAVAAPVTVQVTVPPGRFEPEPVTNAVAVIVCPTVGEVGVAVT
jgi:hypothetical protein